MVRVTARTGGLEGTRLRFDDVEADGIVLSIEGHEGTGKSSLALDAPGPIAYFHTNDGIDRAIPRFRQVAPKKRVAFAAYEWERPEFDQALKKKYKGDAWDKHWEEEAEKIREGAYEPFIRDWYTAIESGEFKTMVQDLATMFWQMFPLAFFGKLQENPQLSWGKVNSAYTDAIITARKAGIHVILVHQVSQVYKNVLNPRTGKQMSQAVEGRFRRKGMKEVAYIADSFVETVLDEAQVFNGKKRGEDEFKIRVLKCKDDMSLSGTIWPEMSFAELATMLKPRVDPAKWEE